MIIIALEIMTEAIAVESSLKPREHEDVEIIGDPIYNLQEKAGNV